MLQGPLGPFFADLADALKERGARTTRICFNKGDWHYAKADRVVPYQGTVEAWPDWLAAFLEAEGVAAVCCYGDCRAYHLAAKAVCDAAGITLFAFEEGYIRPGYVTLEVGGNNANSSFAAAFKAGTLAEREPVPPADIANPFRFQFWFATLYYVVKGWRLTGYWRYRHHRQGNWATEMMAWLTAGYRKQLITRWRERGLTKRLIERHGGRLFLVPLQVAVDSQMIYHSPYDSVTAFIDQMLASFAKSAPAGTHLLIKHHPMDRGFAHYGAQIARAARRLGLESRVTYAFDADLEALMPHLTGCVTVNSTVGIQALKAGVPTLMLGDSMVRTAGLTCTLEVDSFWAAPGTVDADTMERFQRLLAAHTLVPGSFYRDRHIAAAASAVKILSLVVAAAPATDSAPAVAKL